MAALGMSLQTSHIVAASPDISSDAVLLDLWTQLADGPVDGSSYWSVTVYPDCGEASGAFVTSSEPSGGSAWSKLDDDERQALNAERAHRRARSRLRRFSVQNHLRVMWTLTYRCQACHVASGCVCGLRAQPGSRSEVKAHVNRFVTRLRDLGDGARFPYAYVIERGSRGTQRLHVHLLLPPGFSRDSLQSAWIHGHVDVSFRADGLGGREGSRRAAAYAAKYLAKSLGDEDPAWAHSYERAQGFNVREVKGRTLHQHLSWRLAADALGGPVDLSLSEDWEDYYGPPAWAMSLA